MTGTLWHLAVAAIAFVGVHFLTRAPIRARVVAGIGELNWLALFSAVSIALLIWVIWAYSDAPYVELWPDTVWARWLALLVMPVSLVLIACGYLTPNPSIAGAGGSVLTSDEPARGIIKVTRHPLMWGIALWALCHIPANGDAASVILMGSMAGLALIGMPSMDAKLRTRKGHDWERLEGITSTLPFAAILQGRTRVTLGEIGWWRIGIGLALYVAFLLVHEWAIGVPPWPM
ncbi:MAG: NnrU family protein [Alphaproteobacteria bacterium]|nr:NnrU family protein [Alphaproteobacteria bacterium]